MRCRWIHIKSECVEENTASQKIHYGGHQMFWFEILRCKTSLIPYSGFSFPTVVLVCNLQPISYFTKLYSHSFAINYFFRNIYVQLKIVLKTGHPGCIFRSQTRNIHTCSEIVMFVSKRYMRVRLVILLFGPGLNPGMNVVIEMLSRQTRDVHYLIW